MIPVRVRPPETDFDTTRCRALRQMRDRNDLMMTRHGTHLLADDLPDLATDIGVDLVKDQQIHRIMRGQNALDRQHHTRNLTRARNGGERTRRLSRIGL